MNTPGVEPSSAIRLFCLPQHPHDGTDTAPPEMSVTGAPSRSRGRPASPR